MNCGKVVIILMMFIFLILSCAPKQDTIPALVEPGAAPIKEKITAKEPWAEKWEKTLQQAKIEGRVVVYGGSAAAALKTHATRIIKEKFGFDLEVLTARVSLLIPRIGTERANGLFVPDIFLSGPNSSYESLKPWGAIEPLEPILLLPEVLDPKLWLDGSLHWGDKEHKVFIYIGTPDPELAVNSTLVQPGEIKSYYDLMEPKWKGKIV